MVLQVTKQNYHKVEGECSAGGHCLGSQPGDQTEYVKYSHQRCRPVSPPTPGPNTAQPPHNDTDPLSLPQVTAIKKVAVAVALLSNNVRLRIPVIESVKVSTTPMPSYV